MYTLGCKHEHKLWSVYTPPRVSGTLIARMHTPDGPRLHLCSSVASSAPMLRNIAAPASNVCLWQFNLKGHCLVWVKRVEQIKIQKPSYKNPLLLLFQLCV